MYDDCHEFEISLKVKAFVESLLLQGYLPNLHIFQFFGCESSPISRNVVS